MLAAFQQADSAVSHAKFSHSVKTVSYEKICCLFGLKNWNWYNAEPILCTLGQLLKVVGIEK
jgi:hypothetical protein